MTLNKVRTIQPLIAIVILLLSHHPTLAAPPATEPAPTILQRSGTPIGILGHPIGEYLTIEGTRLDAVKTGSSTLNIDTINAQKLPQPIPIWIENLDLPKNQRCILKGYETGRMIGQAPAVEAAAKEQGRDFSLPQAGWQWHPYFVVCIIASPQALKLEHEIWDYELYQLFDKIFPLEAGAIQQAVRKSLDKNAAIAIVNLIEKSRANEPAEIYQDAWFVACRFVSKTTDPAAVHPILKLWNTALKDDQERLRFMLLALAFSPNRQFITPELIRLFNETKDPNAMRGLSYAIAICRLPTGPAILERKIKTLTDPDEQQIIQSNLNWLNHWLSGDKSPGPAEGPSPP